MSSGPFVSHAQNGEDVVLWRALRDVPNGRYVDVGAADPEVDSVTKAFYDRGWTGLDIEPVTAFADRLREQRPRDVVVRAAVTRADEGEVTLHEFADTGLSTVRDDYVDRHVTRGFEVRDVAVPARRLDSLVREHLGQGPVHFCKIDAEGAEADVLASADLASWRPWIVVVEATKPNTSELTHAEWEDAVLAAGYRFCLFDGLNRFYVSEDHLDLAPALSYPACPLDEFVPARQAALAQELADLQRTHGEVVEEHHRLQAQVEPLRAEVSSLRAELVRWRGTALERWATSLVPQDTGARSELAAIQQTISWRVTKPLRAVRRLQLRTGS